MNRRYLFHLLFGGVLVSPAAFLAGSKAGVGFASGPQTPARTELLGEWGPGTRADAIVGAEVCGACHADIAVEQAMHPMARTGAAPGSETRQAWFSDERLRAPVIWRSSGPEPGDRPRYRANDTGIALVDPSGETAAVHAVFGSGLRGVTPVHFTEDGRMRELRVSWSHGLDAWIETPGSEYDRHPLGIVESPRQLRDCVGCHATSVAWDGPAPRPADSEWGVRCERCHGPGETHAGTADATGIFNPGRLSPAEEVRFCGQCHRTPSDFEPLQILQRNRGLARHAGGSLMMSACFRTPAAERTISCTGCHDPHRAEGSVAERSRTVCRDCHEDPAALHDYERVTSASDCLACHMPRREEVFPGAAFTDHRIRVQGAPPAPGSDAERSEMEYLELLYRNELAGPSDSQEEARLLVGLGELLFAQGLRTSAVETLERGLEADPDYQRLLKAGALFRASGQPAPARTALERASAMQPEVAQAFFDLGDLLLAEGDAGEAVAALERGRELDPGSAVVAARLGAAYRAAGRFDEALREGRAAVELDDPSPEIWLELGLTRWRRRELREADEALRTAHELDSDAPAVLDARARLLALDPDPQVRDVAEARRLAERLAGFGGYEDPYSLDLLAAVYAAGGDFDAAVRTAAFAAAQAAAAGEDAFARDIRERLALYREGQAWRSRGPDLSRPSDLDLRTSAGSGPVSEIVYRAAL